MARFLFVISSSPAHFMAPSAVARELESRGNEVAWVADQQEVGDHLPSGAKVFDCSHVIDHDERSEKRAALLQMRGAALHREQMEQTAPIVRATTPVVERAIDSFRPDLVGVHQTAWWGWIAARRKGVPWATLATGTIDRRLAAKEMISSFPKITSWAREWLDQLQEEAGLEPVSEPENSRELVIFFTSRLFVGIEETFPPQYRFVGPAIDRPADDTAFPWSDLRDGPRVLVSLGSLLGEHGARFYEAVKQALGPLDIQVILVAPDRFGPFPDNFIARSWVPQLEILEKVDAVVTHGGANTVHEALCHSLPLVVAPIMNDEAFNARRVVETGAGLRFSYVRPRPRVIRESVERVLEEPRFREAAESLRESFVDAGGAGRAAELLEAAANHQRGSDRAPSRAASGGWRASSS